ncbi:hypothetical protein ACWEOG_37710 [Amycolatopsis japonica]
MFFVAGHGAPDTFTLTSRAGTRHPITGSELARVVTETQAFQQARKERGAPADYVLIACSTGVSAARGGVAHDFVEALADFTEPATVHGPAQQAFVTTDGAIGTANGTRWTTFSARQRPAIRLDELAFTTLAQGNKPVGISFRHNLDASTGFVGHEYADTSYFVTNPGHRTAADALANADYALLPVPWHPGVYVIPDRREGGDPGRPFRLPYRDVRRGYQDVTGYQLAKVLQQAEPFQQFGREGRPFTVVLLEGRAAALDDGPAASLSDALETVFSRKTPVIGPVGEITLFPGTAGVPAVVMQTSAGPLWRAPASPDLDRTVSVVTTPKSASGIRLVGREFDSRTAQVLLPASVPYSPLVHQDRGLIGLNYFHDDMGRYTTKWGNAKSDQDITLTVSFSTVTKGQLRNRPIHQLGHYNVSPWRAHQPGGHNFTIGAHGLPTEITVNRTDGQRFLLTGGNFAWLVTQARHFQTAMASRRPDTYTLASCYTGRLLTPSGAAYDFATMMRLTFGQNQRVYGPSSVVSLPYFTPNSTDAERASSAFAVLYNSGTWSEFDEHGARTSQLGPATLPTGEPFGTLYGTAAHQSLPAASLRSTQTLGRGEQEPQSFGRRMPEPDVVFTGLDHFGRERTFRMRDLLITNLAGTGSVAGISFRDGSDLVRTDFLGNDRAHSDVSFVYPGHQTVDLAVTRNAYALTPAPWSAADGAYLIEPARPHTGHSARHVAVTIADHRRTVLSVDGHTFATVVSMASQFHAASGTSRSSYGLLAGSAAELLHDGGSAVDFQRGLSNALGRNVTVHAPVESMWSVRGSTDQSLIPAAVTDTSAGPLWRRLSGDSSRDSDDHAMTAGGLETISYVGTDAVSGGKVLFSDDDVNIRLLRDTTDRPAALYFQNGDVVPEDAIEYTAADRGQDTTYVSTLDERLTDPDQLSPELGRYEQTPWSLDHPGADPAHVFVHGAPHEFRLRLGEKTLGINGGALAYLSVRSGLIEAAAGGRERTPYVLISCSSGRITEPGGAAADFRTALSHVFDRYDPVYAPTTAISTVPHVAGVSPPVMEDAAFTAIHRGGHWNVFDAYGNGKATRRPGYGRSMQAIQAIGPDGDLMTVHADDLAMTPLHDSRGTIVGIDFTTEEPGLLTSGAWAQRDRAHGDYQQLPPGQDDPTGAYRRSAHLTRRAPWSAAADHPPFFTSAHTTASHARLKTNDGTDIWVVGEGLARAVAASSLFNQAIAGRSPGSFPLLGCAAGASASPAGTSVEFSRTLREFGFGQRTYAPTTNMHFVSYVDAMGKRHATIGLEDNGGWLASPGEEPISGEPAAARTDLTSADVVATRGDLPDQTRTWFDARVEFLRQATVFEHRLGNYLADHALVNQQVDALTRAVWERLPRRERMRLGEGDPHIAGAAGTGYLDVLRVVQAGNFRERMSLLWNAARENLFRSEFPDLHDRNPEITQERQDRYHTEAQKAYADARRRHDLTSDQREELSKAAEAIMRTDLSPDEVRPPLSERERGLALAADGGLRWLPGEKRMGVRMGAAMQAAAEHSGGLVKTGTSGSAYLIMRFGQAIADKWGVPVDPRVLELALLGYLLPTGQHTFHEVATAAQLANPLRDYHNDWGRYRDLAPLGEEEIRAHVAVGNRFPDEHAVEQVKWPDTRVGTGAWVPKHHLAAPRVAETANDSEITREMVMLEALGDRPPTLPPARITTIEFAQGTGQITLPGLRALQQLGYGLYEELAQQRRAALPATSITIVGYGNSLTHAERTGLNRAATVRDALITTLADEQSRMARHGLSNRVLPNLTGLSIELSSAGRHSAPLTTGPLLTGRRRAVAVILTRPAPPASTPVGTWSEHEIRRDVRFGASTLTGLGEDSRRQLTAGAAEIVFETLSKDQLDGLGRIITKNDFIASTALRLRDLGKGGARVFAESLAQRLDMLAGRHS